MSRLNRRAVRTAVVALVGVSAVGLAATTASAKASIDFSAGPRTVHVGGQIRLVGDGGDDASVRQRFCLQERTGHHVWRNLKCSKWTQNGGDASLRIRATHKGTYQFRGAIIEDDSPGQHPVTGPTSGIRTVAVR